MMFQLAIRDFFALMQNGLVVGRPGNIKGRAAGFQELGKIRGDKVPGADDRSPGCQGYKYRSDNPEEVKMRHDMETFILCSEGLF